MRRLAELRESGRAATADDQAILVKYVGWGGLPQAFDHRNEDWAKEYRELSQVLGQDEYEAARRSTQDAHYTAEPVIRAMYHGVQRIGFTGGRMLESSIGTGNFVGLMPQSMSEGTHVTGVELDPTTAAIAKHLYPQAAILNRGFQDVVIPQGHFDLAIGNPPFGSQSLYDAEHPELSKLSIHNYFIAKSLDKVRDGGVVAVVVSSYFLDAQDSTAREHIAGQARLLGAIRLPYTAFKRNALTEVTTDIVFLQKQEGGDLDRTWVGVGEVLDKETGVSIPVNAYYVANPDAMLGSMSLSGKGYRSNMPRLDPHEGQDLDAALMAAMNRLPSGVYQSRVVRQITAEKDVPKEVPEGLKIGAYFVEQGRVAKRLPDLLDERRAEWVELKNERAGERIIGMVRVRDSLRRLMQAEREDSADELTLERYRRDLNRAYDEFVKQHGFISAQANRLAMSEDPEYPLLHALERDYDKGISADVAAKQGVAPRAPSAKKAAIFERRVIAPRRILQEVGSAKEALVASMNETGGVDIPLMVRLSGKSESDLLNELHGLVFRDPTTNRWETGDRYLSGNVKEKLALASRAASTDPTFEANVRALEKVVPPDIEPVDIAIQLGSTWVPPSVVDEFIGHVLGPVHRQISYQPSLGKWITKIGRADSTTMTVKWGTVDAPANTLIEMILANRPIQVKDQVGKDEQGNPIYRLNETKTAAAAQKADELRQEFLDWVWEDQDRRNMLAKLYNDRFNCNVAPTYDGSHLTLPGMSMDIQLRPNQKNAIWRGIQEGGTLYDHRVGAGKTMVLAGVALEGRRLGLIRKPMLVVPNHLLLQWKDAIYAMYPDANVLVAEKTDFTKENREKLFARIATGDWDAVVVGHSSFKKIGMPKETLQEILEEQISDLADAVIALKQERGDRMTIKEMEKAKERMEAKLKRAADNSDKDQAVDFADLGVDALMVDEMQEFKNLFITTSMSGIAGLGNLAGSEKAFDLFVKARYLQKKYDGRGFYPATGTVISNTIAEMYTIQRYCQYDDMKSRGIHHFDAWASTFGQAVTGWELDATGVNYRLNTRFAKFQNVPELIAMYRTFADVVTKEDLERFSQERGERFPIPKIKGAKPRNIIVPRSEQQAWYMGVQEPVRDDKGAIQYRADGSVMLEWNEGSIIHRMENLPDNPSIDNPLKVTNDARKAGLDFRLINPAAEDFADSKVNACVRETYRIWKEWEAQKGTQLIFCDLSTPKGGSSSVIESVRPARDEQGAELDQDDDAPSIAMDELLSRNDRFSVYDDIKAKLVANGVPAEEIAFIHDAKTDLQKDKLFAKMNRGELRVLIGSTTKMGAGTNVQKKLVALHDLDAPWRPSDLEQRLGRIERQGNEFYAADPDGFEIEVLRYATEKTYDARMWQTIEYKAAGIEQFRKGDALQRTIEDIAGQAANAAEMKAAASGNPLIFAQVQLTADLKKLEAVYANWKRGQHQMQAEEAWLSKAQERADSKRTEIQKDIIRRNAGTSDPWRFAVGARTYTPDDKEGMLHVVVAAMTEAVKYEAKMLSDKAIEVPIGKYRGFEIRVSAQRGEVHFTLMGDRPHWPGNLRYGKEDEFNLNGWLRRVDNYVDGFEASIQQVDATLKADLEAMSKLQKEKGRGFAQIEKLEMLRKDVSDVMVELKKCQADPQYVSEWKPRTTANAPEQSQPAQGRAAGISR